MLHATTKPDFLETVLANLDESDGPEKFITHLRGGQWTLCAGEQPNRNLDETVESVRLDTEQVCLRGNPNWPQGSRRS